MSRILIIEDNPEKLKRIIAFLNNECKVIDEYIDCAGNVQEGYDLLCEKSYDLLLLDLVLPKNKEDEPSAESGMQFLDEIHYNPNINIPIHIIGLTEFDNVFKDCYEQFEDKLWALVNFQLQSTDWTNKLKSKIFYLQNFKKNYKSYIKNEK